MTMNTGGPNQANPNVQPLPPLQPPAKGKLVQNNSVLARFASPIFSGNVGDIAIGYGKVSNNPDGAQTPVGFQQGSNFFGSTTSRPGGVSVDMTGTASPRFNDGNIIREVQFPITLANGQRGLVETKNGVTSYTGPNGARQVLSAQNPRIDIGPGVVLTLENSVGEISSQNPLRYNNPEVRPVLRIDDTNGDPNKAPLEISFDTRVGGRFLPDGSYAEAPDNVKYADYVNGQPFPAGFDTWTDIDIQRVKKNVVQPPSPTPTPNHPTPDPWIPDDFGLPILPPDCPVPEPTPAPAPAPSPVQPPAPAPAPKTPDPWINMDAPNPDDFGFGILDPGDWGVPQPQPNPQPPVNETDPWLNQDAPNPDDFGLGFPQDKPSQPGQQGGQLDLEADFLPTEDEIQ